MLDPRQGLNRLAEAHVVGQDRAQPESGHVGEKVEALLLVRAKLAAEGRHTEREAVAWQLAFYVMRGPQDFNLIVGRSVRSGYAIP